MGSSVASVSGAKGRAKYVQGAKGRVVCRVV